MSSKLEELSQLLQSLASRFLQVYVVIDALDELATKDQCLESLLSHIQALQAACHVKLLTTSRYIPSLKGKFEDPLCLDIRASDKDIETYVSGYMKHLAKSVQGRLDLQKSITESIIATADGM